MLVLKRRADQQIVIAGTIRITILKLRDSSVTIGIDAPISAPILRGELLEEKRTDSEQEQQDSANRECPTLTTSIAPSQH